VAPVVEAVVPAVMAPVEPQPPVAPPAPYVPEPAPVVEPAAPAEPEEALVAPVEPPQATASVPPAPIETPPAAEPPRASHLDPSRRAADALAMRLGQLKKGRGVTTLSEEYDMSKLEGALADSDLEAIVKQTSRNVVDTNIGTDQMLVHNPYALEDAAEALAERLGKKKNPRRIDESKLGDVLGDTKIDEIMGTLMPRVGDDAVEEQPEPASIDKASENLAKLLGKTKKKSNRPWYEQ
jgi:hypothetical protein